MNHYKQLTFTGRLVALLGVVVGLTIVNSIIPHDFEFVRNMVAFVQLGFSALVMGITVGRVLEDY